MSPNGSIRLNLITGVAARIATISSSFFFIGIANRSLDSQHAASVASLTGILAVTSLTQVGIGSTVLRHMVSAESVSASFLQKQVVNARQALKITSFVAMAVCSAWLIYAIFSKTPSIIIAACLGLATSYTASLQIAEWSLMASRRSYITQMVTIGVCIALVAAYLASPFLFKNMYAISALIYASPILTTIIVHNASLLKSSKYKELYEKNSDTGKFPTFGAFKWGTVLSISSAVFDASIMWLSLITRSVDIKYVLIFRLIYATSSAMQVIIQPTVMQFVSIFRASSKQKRLWLWQSAAQGLFALLAGGFTYMAIGPAIAFWRGAAIELSPAERVAASLLAALWPTLSWVVQLTFHAQSDRRAAFTMAFCAVVSGSLLISLFLTRVVADPLMLLVPPMVCAILFLNLYPRLRT